MKNKKHSFSSPDFSSVELVPELTASAAFVCNSSSVFREDEDTLPIGIGEDLQYMPWGAANDMPFRILELIEKDETLSTCQMFNAEICYGSGLQYNTSYCSKEVSNSIDSFFLDNPLSSYFLGVCQDFKHFGFCVSVIILSKDGKQIVRLLRKEACYCRFAPIDRQGSIPYILYANWRKNVASADEVEKIELLSVTSPWQDLAIRMGRACGSDGKTFVRTKVRKFAILTRVPTPDSTYYPIPYYASLFKGNWYNIKQLIGMAKEAKLKNSAPLKYHIEISNKYWENLFRSHRITDIRKKQELVRKKKQEIIDFLTGIENSGKAWFSTFYQTPDNKESHEVVINKVDTTKEGGDWESDIIEAINMFCFTMRVHSNLVGSVPGKSQVNNSGSDKRELYTIAQALQKPYHDLLFTVHRIIIKYNSWDGAFPECPFIQLTTLDEHSDAKQVNLEKANSLDEEENGNKRDSEKQL